MKQAKNKDIIDTLTHYYFHKVFLDNGFSHTQYYFTSSLLKGDKKNNVWIMEIFYKGNTKKPCEKLTIKVDNTMLWKMLNKTLRKQFIKGE